MNAPKILLCLFGFAVSGCAIPQGYSVKVGAGYEDQNGNDYGGYVEVSKAYRSVNLPVQYSAEGLKK